MNFYPQFPAIYAYPMPFPNQDYYMYPPGGGHGGHGGTGNGPHDDGPIYFDHHQQSMMHKGMMHHHHHHSTPKPGYNNRKVSADSGISDYSVGRKTSSTSTISNSSMMDEPHQLDDVIEEEPFEEPEDDLCETIVQQVEFYFSDANITKDKFLLKHVKRNKEGFVSLKLISSFKRVKHLTKDWRQVAFAIERKSAKLEVNDLKTKVRRLESLPEYDETTPSRTVVALNLPLERPTIEAVAEIFSACGDIVLVRILRPGNPVPADIKPFANKHPEMTDKVCALVEFERTEFAHKAVRDLDNQEEEDKMKVMELTAPPPKSTKKDAQKKTMKVQMQQQFVFQQQQQAGQGQQRRFSHAGFHIPQHQNPDQLVLGPRRRISLMHNMKFTPISEEEQHKKDFSLNPNAPTFQMQQQQQQPRRISRPSYMHPMDMSAMQMQFHHQQQHQQSPWMIRRLSAGMHLQQHPAEFCAPSGLTLPPNVVRMPKGPEVAKGKGFQKWCRSRMETKKPGSHAVPIVAPPAEDDEAAKVEGASEEKEEKKDAVPIIKVDLAKDDEVVNNAVESSSSGADSGHEDEGLLCFGGHDNERTR